MDNYKLGQEEVVILKAAVNIEGEKGEHELMLTNLQIVIFTTVKKLFKQTENSVAEYSLQDIKIYKDKPYVTQKGGRVVIYLRDKELTVEFESMFTATKFCDKIVEIYTGRNIALRGAEKVKGALGVVDDTLGIDSVGVVGSIIKSGVMGTLLHGSGQEVRKRKISPEDDKIKEIEKYKKLFNQGVITEEEFNAKKKQILGL